MFVEDQNTELKANLTDKFEIEIVAFLNSNNGGDLYIGVDDCGKPIGIDNLDETQLTIASRIKNNILPATLGLFDVLVEKEKGISYIHVIVTSGLENHIIYEKKGCRQMVVLLG